MKAFHGRCGRAKRDDRAHVHAEGKETAAVMESVEGESFSWSIPVPGSQRVPGNRDCSNQTTVGDHGTLGVKGSESPAVSPSPVNSGSVLVLGRETGWKYWTPSHKRAICGVSLEAVSLSGQRPLPFRVPASVPSQPPFWRALHLPLPFCVGHVSTRSSEW